MDARPCERQCQRCRLWKHHSRFKAVGRTTDQKYDRFDPVCRDCRQKERNDRKNADRALSIIGDRASSHARKAGVAKVFFMVNMNYVALVAVLRAMMTSEGVCLCCGHPFVNERDIQIEHREPPRHQRDWARLHARNLGLACASCNRTKASKPYALWLDEQEAARLSNELDPTAAAGGLIADQLEFVL